MEESISNSIPTDENNNSNNNGAFQARGQYTFADLENTDEYNAKTSSDVGSKLLGYYIEAGYNLLEGGKQARHTDITKKKISNGRKIPLYNRKTHRHNVDYVTEPYRKNL